MLIFLQLFLCQCECRFIHQSRNWNLDPVLTRPLMVGAVAATDPIPLAQGTSDPLPRPQFRLTKTSFPCISGIPQNAPHCRTLPASFCTASRNLPFIQQSCNCVDAQILHRVVFKYHADNLSFGFNHFVIGFRMVALLHISITVRRPRQYIDDALLSLVPFAAATPFGDLGPLILGDHSLKLHQS